MALVCHQARVFARGLPWAKSGEFIVKLMRCSAPFENRIFVTVPDEGPVLSPRQLPAEEPFAGNPAGQEGFLGLLNRSLNFPEESVTTAWPN